jgi:hypothetical protein
MRHQPASRYIADLGPKKETPPAPRPDAPSGPEALQLFSVHDKNNPQQRLAAARQEGVEEGKAAGKAEFEARLKEQRAQFDQQLSLERVTWATREADRLAEQITAGLQEVEARIADAAAELLKPFLATAVHRRAIGELHKAIETILSKDEGITLEISGPSDLLQLLRERLSGKNMTLLFHPGEGPEVRIVAGQTTLETQLGAWAAKVEEALR